MKRLFLGIDVSTTGAKALLIDEKGAVVASATTPLTAPDPAAALVRAGSARVVDGDRRAASARPWPRPAASGERRGGGRPHRPDARPGAARREARGPAPRHPVERPAHRRRVRRDRAARRPEGAHPRGRATSRSPASPRRRSSGSATTSRRCTRRRSSCSCRRTTCACASPASRPWTRRTAPARSCSSSRPATGRGRPGEARHPRRVAAADVRGTGDDGHASRPRPRPRRGSASRHAGHGRRRRSGRGRGRRGRGAARRRLADARHVGRGLRHHRQRRSSSREGRLHAFCHAVPGSLALHGRDARRRPAACSGTATPWRRRRASPRSWPRPSGRPRAARGCSSCPTSRASGRRIPTRSRAAASWASPCATAGRT